ncbi:MAG: divalent-cation tolerance protein CutA [Planctomycetia bacterium]|nr:divalent-cation tolerance protein CutA [Planctomycetia bacterium]
MSELLHVTTTTAGQDEAERIAACLVERRLAACVQIQGPIKSTYRWQGRIERAEEWQVTIKTSRERFAEVVTAIGELHSYQLPEIVATPVVDGSPEYLAWWREQVTVE